MRQRIYLFSAIAILLGPSLLVTTASTVNDKDARFRVRIENISTNDGFTATGGTKYPFALSPGLWVIHQSEIHFFKEGIASGVALERQAEDGNPGELAKDLVDQAHSSKQHGIFNTPVGASAPGPLLPGAAYEFTLSGKPGMKIWMTMMFGQSNDWFYAPGTEGVSLFANGKPINADITSKFILYDAGSEKDEEIGTGPNQAPRQKAPNTGEDEHGVVRKAKSSVFFKKTNELFRVTIAPEERM
jgi:hypothetical protein